MSGRWSQFSLWTSSQSVRASDMSHSHSNVSLWQNYLSLISQRFFVTKSEPHYLVCGCSWISWVRKKSVFRATAGRDSSLNVPVTHRNRNTNKTLKWAETRFKWEKKVGRVKKKSWPWSFKTSGWHEKNTQKAKNTKNYVLSFFWEWRIGVLKNGILLEILEVLMRLTRL